MYLILMKNPEMIKTLSDTLREKRFSGFDVSEIRHARHVMEHGPKIRFVVAETSEFPKTEMEELIATLRLRGTRTFALRRERDFERLLEIIRSCP